MTNLGMTDWLRLVKAAWKLLLAFLTFLVVTVVGAVWGIVEPASWVAEKFGKEPLIRFIWALGGAVVGLAFAFIHTGRQRLAVERQRDESYRKVATLEATAVTLENARAEMATQLAATESEAAALRALSVTLEQAQTAWLKMQATAITYLLHQRWFADKKDALAIDRDYRVSLFVRRKRNGGYVWVCFGRTNTPPENAREWEDTADSQASERAGLIVWAYLNGAPGVYVSGVPVAKRDDDAYVAPFLRKSRIRAEDCENLSWPYASIAVRFPTKRGEVAFSVVIERKCGEEIDPAITKDIFDNELQFAADMWCCPRGAEA